MLSCMPVTIVENSRVDTFSSAVAWAFVTNAWIEDKLFCVHRENSSNCSWETFLATMACRSCILSWVPKRCCSEASWTLHAPPSSALMRSCRCSHTTPRSSLHEFCCTCAWTFSSNLDQMTFSCSALETFSSNAFLISETSTCIRFSAAENSPCNLSICLEHDFRTTSSNASLMPQHDCILAQVKVRASPAVSANSQAGMQCM
mmetsp:Transcript_102956/g.178645  ORF Transcript_102956/g.178645 Transcript_102956/m.178645 type:complete len:203 (+) Transcript_102956:923-1531(+)